MSKPKNLRADMPLCAVFIDGMRQAFDGHGDAPVRIDDGLPPALCINDRMKQGMAGMPVFWAREGGHEIGSRPAAGVEVVPLLPIVIERKGRR